MNHKRWNRLLFNTTSPIYDALTNQKVWRDQVGEVLDHVENEGEIRRVLDLGCGPGTASFELAKRLPEATIDGVDLSEQMIVRAKRHHASSYPQWSQIRFHVGDATLLPWPDETFDLAVGHSFLYLVPEPIKVLEQARRVLTRGGSLVLLEPNRAGSLRTAATSAFGHDLTKHAPVDVARFQASMVAWRVVSGSVGRLQPETVKGWMAEAGFDEVEIRPTLGGLGMHCIGRVAPGIVGTSSDVS